MLELKKVRSPNISKRIGSIIIFHLSKLCKVRFSILHDVIFLWRLQEKIEIDHSSMAMQGKWGDCLDTKYHQKVALQVIRSVFSDRFPVQLLLALGLLFDLFNFIVLLTSASRSYESCFINLRVAAYSNNKNAESASLDDSLLSGRCLYTSDKCAQWHKQVIFTPGYSDPAKWNHT